MINKEFFHYVAYLYSEYEGEFNFITSYIFKDENELVDFIEEKHNKNGCKVEVEAVYKVTWE